MKKTTLSLLAIALIAVCSAFSTKGKKHSATDQSYKVDHVTGSGSERTFYLVNTVDQGPYGDAYVCSGPSTDPCTVVVSTSATIHSGSPAYIVETEGGVLGYHTGTFQ